MTELPELHLTQQQLRALIEFTRDHEYSVKVARPGEPWGADYVRFALIDADGNETDAIVLTYAGVPPRAEAIPPEWDREDDG